MTTTQLCFIDTETTGLDARIHQPYEVSWWLEGTDKPETWNLPHSLDHADGGALRIGGYFDRGFAPYGGENERQAIASRLMTRLHGVTLVGSNPSFDAQMLRRFIGCEVWHHRLVDVSQGAMWVLGLERPPGLAKAAELLRDRGFEIPEADHTAEGDVRATRAVYLALDALRDAR
jgi:hypothetical protein